MALKSIIVNIHEVEELVTFPSDIDTEDLVELFRSAALANTSDVLQLRAANSRAIVPITCDLAENDRSSPYVLTVVQAPKQVEGGRTRKVSAFYQQRMEELRSMSRSNLNAPYGSRGNLVPPSDDESDCEGADSMPPRLPLNTNMGPAPAVAPAIAHRQPAARRDSITSFGLSFAPGRKTSMAIGGRMTQPGRSNEKAIGMDLPSSVTSRLRKNSVFAEEGSRKARLLSDVRHVTKEHLETLQAEARRVREVELAELRPRFLIAHDSRFAQVWTTTYLTAMVIDAFVIPFAIAFPEGNDGVPIGLLITYIMDLVLIADIFLRFQWEYMDGERRVDTAREISRHYRKKQFRWDVFGVFPFDFIALGYGGVYLLPLLRLNRLVNLPKIFRHFKAEENDIKRETGMIRVRMYIIGGFLIMHVLACIWHLISCYPTIDGNLTHCRRNGWVSASDGQIGDSKFSAYISSLYWTVCSMTSVGYGDILAQNDYERIYACIVMILGVCLFSFVMGNVASAVASADAMRDEFRQKVRTVRQYMAYHDIRADLQMAIDDYYANEWNIKHGVDTSFYNSLPEAFRAEIALEINRKQLVKVPVFLDCNEDILKELALRMRPTSILANKFILRRGEESHDMFFLMEGLVRVISEDDGTVYAELGKGNFFGEVGVLFDLPRTATVITASHCDMFLLGKEDMLDVVARFEPLKDKLNQCAGERLMWFKKHRYVDTGNDFGGNLEMEMNLENLRKVDLFRDCGDEELLRELSAAMETIMYEPGDLIIKKGTIGHEMFFINRGTVIITGDSEDQIFATVGEGAYFGEIGILFSVPRIANVRAVSHCHLMVLFKETFDMIMDNHPEIRERIMETANRRMNKPVAAKDDKQNALQRTLRRMSHIGPLLRSKRSAVGPMPDADADEIGEFDVSETPDAASGPSTNSNSVENPRGLLHVPSGDAAPLSPIASPNAPASVEPRGERAPLPGPGSRSGSSTAASSILNINSPGADGAGISLPSTTPLSPKATD